MKMDVRISRKDKTVISQQPLPAIFALPTVGDFVSTGEKSFRVTERYFFYVDENLTVDLVVEDDAGYTLEQMTQAFS